MSERAALAVTEAVATIRSVLNQRKLAGGQGLGSGNKGPMKSRLTPSVACHQPAPWNLPFIQTLGAGLLSAQPRRRLPSDMARAAASDETGPSGRIGSRAATRSLQRDGSSPSGHRDEGMRQRSTGSARCSSPRTPTCRRSSRKRPRWTLVVESLYSLRFASCQRTGRCGPFHGSWKPGVITMLTPGSGFVHGCAARFSGAVMNPSME